MTDLIERLQDDNQCTDSLRADAIIGIERLTEQRDRLGIEYDESQKEIERLTADVVLMQEQREQEGRELVRLQARVESLTAEKSEAIQAFAAEVRKNVALQARVETLEGVIAKLRGEAGLDLYDDTATKQGG